ncbi:hypothetical protein [Verrucomicrobium sp. BvORR106]|uniref:hypothetical protein n=1 Tax=Verrucomicrobium sp. BvORR106 TaxID=1403819 RepID=UPI00056F05EE|nr:hypothetical protein [Verrucomicrobium sp. BvORR106]
MSLSSLHCLRPLIFAAWGALGLGAAVAHDVVLRIEPLVARIPASSGAAVKVSVTNNGSEPVTLVRPGDGSLEGQKTPVIEFSWVPRDERKLENPQAPPMEYPKNGCANLLPITMNDVFRLAPHETRVLAEFLPVRKLPAQSGRYAVVFFYLNLPSMGLPGPGIPSAAFPNKAGGLRETGADVVAALRGSLPCLLRSNEVVFEIDPAAPSPDYESLLKGKPLPAR